MDWDGVRAGLARHAVVMADDRSIVVTLRMPAGALRVRAERVQAFDEDWLLLLAPVCPETRASLRDALTANMQLAIAAHAIEQGWLVLRATHPLRTLDAASLDRTVRFVAEEALRMRAIYMPDHETTSRAFAHFGE